MPFTDTREWKMINRIKKKDKSINFITRWLIDLIDFIKSWLIDCTAVASMLMPRTFLNLNSDRLWIVRVTSCKTWSHCSVAGSQDGRIHVWNSENGSKTAVLDGKHPGPLQCIKFNPRFMMLASSCTNMAFWLPTVEEWRHNEWTTPREWPVEDAPFVVSFQGNSLFFWGDRWCSCADNDLWTFDHAGGDSASCGEVEVERMFLFVDFP